MHLLHFPVKESKQEMGWFEMNYSCCSKLWSFLVTLILKIKFQSFLKMFNSLHENIIELLLLSRFGRVWLCNPIDGSPPGFSVPAILQARILEWVAISFSNYWTTKCIISFFFFSDRLTNNSHTHWNFSI